MMLLGITGGIGHGKTTLAESISYIEPTAAHLESGVLISRVTDELNKHITEPYKPDDVDGINGWLSALPPILQRVVHVDTTLEAIKVTPEEVAEKPVEFEKLHEYLAALHVDPSLARQTIDARNKHLFRPILQWLGGHLVKKVHPGIWFDELVREANINDRNGIELNVIGGVRYPSDAAIIRRAGGTIIEIFRPGLEEKYITDPTERERSLVVPDITVINNGTTEDLPQLAATLLSYIRGGTAQSRYAVISE